jgi:hypothetical protein
MRANYHSFEVVVIILTVKLHLRPFDGQIREAPRLEQDIFLARLCYA